MNWYKQSQLSQQTKSTIPLHHSLKMPENKQRSYEDLYWDLVEISYSVIHGYERYLLNQLSSNELAKIMKMMHKELPDEDRDRRET